MRWRARWLVLAALAAAPLLAGQEYAWPAPEALRRLPIQHNGRTKPFDSFAREVLTQMSGQDRIGREAPVISVLTMAAAPERWQNFRLLSVPYGPLRQKLGLGPKQDRASLAELLASKKLMQLLPPLVEKQQRDEPLSVLEHETWDLYQRFALFNAILDQQLALVPSATRSWSRIDQPEGLSDGQRETLLGAWHALLATIKDEQLNRLEDDAERLARLLREVAPEAYPAAWRIRLELFYNDVQPFRVAQFVYVAAALMIGFSMRRRGRWQAAGMAVLGLAWAVHLGGIALRVILGERPPVSNFFETVLWFPFVAVTLALVLERFQPSRYLALAASILAAASLAIAQRLPLDASITPVVAVLRSNLWLTIHVLTIVGSYGVLALAMVLAHVQGWLYLRRGPSHPSLPLVDGLLYRLLQIGVVTLAAGIVLGAVWANASWGRYWGWDPKETWALITLLWFIAVLHGRMAGWLRGVRVAAATIGGFLLVLMTYYGVSFHLIGLHSYAGGHAKPLPGLLVGYLAAEAAFLLALAVVSRRRPSASS